MGSIHRALRDGRAARIGDENVSRVVGWFSCGAASAVAMKLMLRKYPDALIVYCHTGSEDPDNERFMRDCEKWFGREVTVIKSEKYDSTWAVWEGESYLAGPDGASCTRALKVKPRLAFQQPGDVHVFGYTADPPDQRRAKMFKLNFSELLVKTPLIDDGLTKAGCRATLKRAGLREPRTYAEGFPNANCMPCVKAQSPAYWALVRLKRPDEFARMVELSRRLGVRLAKMKGERVFIDDIPADHPVTGAEVPSCDFMCIIAEHFITRAEDEEQRKA